MAEAQVQGVPEGLTEEALPAQGSPAIQGVPEGLTEEPLSSSTSTVTKPAPSTWDKVKSTANKADTAITGAMETRPSDEPRAAFAKTLGREGYSAAKTVAGLAPAVVGAFTEPPQNEEEKKTVAEHPYLGTAATGLKRMLVDPIQNAAQWYGKAFKGQIPNPVEQALSVAPEAIGSAAGQVVAGEAAGKLAPRAAEAAPKAIETVKGVANKIGPQLRSMRDVITSDESGLDMPHKPATELESNVAAQQKLVAPLQKDVDAAQADVDAHAASKAAGVPIPERFTAKLEKAKAALLDQQKHLDLAEQAAGNVKAGRPNATPAKPAAAALEATPTPARRPARESGEALGGSALRNPLANAETPATVPARESGEALGAIPTKTKAGELGSMNTPAARPARETGEALGTRHTPDQPITAETVKSAPGTSMSPEGRPEAKAAPAAKDIAEYHNQNRGFTYNMEQGFVKDKPVFSVAGEHPDLEQVIPGQNISTEQVQKYMDRPDVKEALKDPQKSVGGWFDGKGSHLEVSRLFTDKAEAIQAGKDLNQVEIYDHANKTGIPTGGTGEAPAAAEAPKVPEAPKAEEPKAAEEAPKGGIADHTSDEAQDFEHNVNKGNNPMGPDSLRQMREFAAENTDKPVKFLNEGQEATVFDLGNGKVMRISKGEAPEMPDIPEALKPESTKEVQGASGKFHATISPKVSTEGISYQDVLDMTKKLSNKGYTWDATEANLGKTPDGEVKVIDAGAIKKNAAAEGNTDVENIIKDHGEQNLIKAGKEYEVNHEDYDFAKRDENRHRVDRDRFAKDVAAKVPEPMVQKLLKAEQAFDDADDPMFTDAERSSASRSTRAKAIWDAAHEGGVAEHMAAKGPAPEATTETAKMSNAELLKKGFTQDDIDAGLNLPKAGGAAEGKNVTGIPDEMSRLLTKEEREGISKSQVGATNAVNKLMKLPKVQEFVDIALQGEGGRKWYQRSSQAFEALKQALPEYFKEAGDKDKFLNLLASSSPQQSVKMNLQETLHVWSKYVDQGRPTGKALESMLNKEFTLKEAKTPNAMKALAGEDMWPDITKNNAFKAPSFGANLRGWLNHVTNDGWMAKFGGMTAAELSNPSSYHPLSVATRAAAEALGWEPAEAQAAIWAFTKAFDEHGETDPEMIKQYSSDFADLIAHDTDIQKQLEELGVNKEILNEHLAKVEPKPEVTGRTTPTTADSVARLGERIKRAKEQGRETAPKDQPELALTEGTEFNPNEPEKPKGDHPEVKKPVEFRRPEDTENHVKMKELGKPKKKSALGKTR